MHASGAIATKLAPFVALAFWPGIGRPVVGGGRAGRPRGAADRHRRRAQHEERATGRSSLARRASRAPGGAPPSPSRAPPGPERGAGPPVGCAPWTWCAWATSCSTSVSTPTLEARRRRARTRAAAAGRHLVERGRLGGVGGGDDPGARPHRRRPPRADRASGARRTRRRRRASRSIRAAPTGTMLVLHEPGERSMVADRGANARLAPGDLPPTIEAGAVLVSGLPVAAGRRGPRCRDGGAGAGRRALGRGRGGVVAAGRGVRRRAVLRGDRRRPTRCSPTSRRRAGAHGLDGADAAAARWGSATGWRR